ncbi:MAG: TGS domain-containing protein, partial [Clostridia bacterium]
MKIKLRDAEREFERGTTLKEIAASISEGLARIALIARVNGKLMDLSQKIYEDSEVEFLTFEDEDGKKAYRHSAAHIMAQAVKRIYPTAKVAIGPSIENGF